MYLMLIPHPAAPATGELFRSGPLVLKIASWRRIHFHGPLMDPARSPPIASVNKEKGERWGPKRTTPAKRWLAPS